jgi:hypothetical protein
MPPEISQKFKQMESVIKELQSSLSDCEKKMDHVKGLSQEKIQNEIRSLGQQVNSQVAKSQQQMNLMNELFMEESMKSADARQLLK